MCKEVKCCATDKIKKSQRFVFRYYLYITQNYLFIKLLNVLSYRLYTFSTRTMNTSLTVVVLFNVSVYLYIVHTNGTVSSVILESSNRNCLLTFQLYMNPLTFSNKTNLNCFANSQNRDTQKTIEVDCFGHSHWPYYRIYHFMIKLTVSQIGLVS